MKIQLFLCGTTMDGLGTIMDDLGMIMDGLGKIMDDRGTTSLKILRNNIPIFQNSILSGNRR
jgi:hypothetical protein